MLKPLYAADRDLVFRGRCEVLAMQSQNDTGPGHVASEPTAREESAKARAPRAFTRLPFSGWLLFLVAGSAAGVLTAASLHVFDDFLQVPADTPRPSWNREFTPEELVRVIAAYEHLNRQRTAMAIGFFGMFTCGLLSMAAGLTRGARRSSLTGTALGVLLGGSLGALAGLVGCATETRLRSVTEDEFLRIIGMHSAYWIIAGIGIGMAIGLTRGTRMAIPKSLFVAVVAGVLAAVVYSPLAGTLFPIESGDAVIPYSLSTRLLWTTLTAVLMALLLARSITIYREVPASKPAV